MSVERALEGCRVVVTRDHPGELGRLLDERGAVVLHVPLIEITGPPDGGVALRSALDELARFDWLIVTSVAGAEAVGQAANAHRELRLGAVGTATARRLADLAGREVDLVPSRQLGASLAAKFVDAHRSEPRQRVLLALGDRAASTLHDELGRAGHLVTTATAYRTELRALFDDDRTVIADADAVLFASGSAAQSWAEALGSDADRLLPAHVIAIGPSTAAVARQNGLKLTGVAADHSLAGLVNELNISWRSGVKG